MTSIASSNLPTNWIRKIDRTAKTITVYKAFLIASGEYGSIAYQLRMELAARYPGFDFIQYKPNRTKTDEVYDNPTYSQMEKFIKGYEATEKGAAEVMAELNDLRMLLKGRKGAYPKVKEWFLNKYADEFARRKKEETDKKRKERESSFLYHPAANN